MPVQSACTELARFEELFSLATLEASRAVSAWTSGDIGLTLESVRELTLMEASTELDFHPEPQVNVALTIAGKWDGAIILVFDPQGARELAVSLVGEEALAATGWTELGRSALEETGNILGCAYLNVLTYLLGEPLSPSPPRFLEDYVASVVEQALMGQAACERVLICRTLFRRQQQQLAWRVFFLPCFALRRRLEEAAPHAHV